MIRSSGTHATLAESSAVLIDAPAASAASQLETRAIAQTPPRLRARRRVMSRSVTCAHKRYLLEYGHVAAVLVMTATHSPPAPPTRTRRVLRAGWAAQPDVSGRPARLSWLEPRTYASASEGTAVAG